MLQDKLANESTSGTYLFADVEAELRLPPGSMSRVFAKAAEEKFTFEMAPESVRFKRKPRDLNIAVVGGRSRGWDRF